MGVETLAIMSVVMGVTQGIAANSAKQSEASMRESEGVLLESEAMREASLIEDEGRRFADSQKMAYIGSGVEIGGSAVVTLAQTDKWAKTEADAVRSRAKSLRAYYDRAGQIARNQGKAAFVSSVAGGVAQGAGMYASAKMPGTGGTAPTSSGGYWNQSSLDSYFAKI